MTVRTKPKATRCAIYTRVSTDARLGQDFNSLEAQREACEAYIVSQKHEGWRLIQPALTMAGIQVATSIVRHSNRFSIWCAHPASMWLSSTKSTA